MKRFLAFAACFGFFASLAYSSLPEDYYSYSFARLSYVQGDVFVERGEDLGLEEGVVNLVLVEGDKLSTNQGRAEVHLGRHNFLRANQFTQIDFVRLPREGDDLIELHLLTGEIFLRVNFLDREKDIEIHTPDGSFYMLKEGLYRLCVRENRETELHVFEGAAEVAGEENSLLIRDEEQITIANGYFQSDPVFFNASYGDDFASWSRSRDMQVNRIVVRRYLPVELYEYEVELASYGYWIYERPYGYVWIPYVHHDHWRPYFHGRWVWYPLIGWNWVSHEPWGWCVYHYGRWHWRVGLGWYWIPSRYWGPAWVHWHWGYDYVGWCPLSYYGYPVVIINNHFYGHYYDRYYPLHSRALTVVHKSQLQAPRISSVALSQSKVVKLGRISLSSQQPPIKPLVSRSAVAKSVTAQGLSRPSLRPAKKFSESGKMLDSSGIRNIRSKTSSQTLSRTQPSRVSLSQTVKKRGSPSVRSSGQGTTKESSSEKRRTTSQSSFSRINQTTRSGQSLKVYPSRERLSSISHSQGLSSSSGKRLEISASRSKSTSHIGSKYSVKSDTSRQSRASSGSWSSARFVGQKSSSFSPSRIRSQQSLRPRAYTSQPRNYPEVKSSSRSSTRSGYRLLSSRSSSSPKIQSPRSTPKISSSRQSSSAQRSSSARLRKK